MSSKKTKVAPYMVYMGYRRRQLEASGKQFPNGWSDVSKIVDSEWTKMDKVEREEWKRKGRQVRPYSSSRHHAKPPNISIERIERDFNFTPRVKRPYEENNNETLEAETAPVVIDKSLWVPNPLHLPTSPKTAANPKVKVETVVKIESEPDLRCFGDILNDLDGSGSTVALDSTIETPAELPQVKRVKLSPIEEEDLPNPYGIPSPTLPAASGSGSRLKVPKKLKPKTLFHVSNTEQSLPSPNNIDSSTVLPAALYGSGSSQLLNVKREKLSPVPFEEELLNPHHVESPTLLPAPVPSNSQSSIMKREKLSPVSFEEPTLQVESSTLLLAEEPVPSVPSNSQHPNMKREKLSPVLLNEQNLPNPRHTESPTLVAEKVASGQSEIAKVKVKREQLSPIPFEETLPNPLHVESPNLLPPPATNTIAPVSNVKREKLPLDVTFEEQTLPNPLHVASPTTLPQVRVPQPEVNIPTASTFNKVPAQVPNPHFGKKLTPEPEETRRPPAFVSSQQQFQRFEDIFERRPPPPVPPYVYVTPYERRLEMDNQPWQTSRVLQTFDENEIFLKIRCYFDSISVEEDFMSLKFPFVHFNFYSSTSRLVYAPAEFAVVAWSLQNGMEFCGGSPIDPGEKVDDMSEAIRQSDWLSLPRPQYTYNKGAAYSVGEDRYGHVFKAVFDQGFFMPQEGPGIENFRYVFAAEDDTETKDNIKITRGCLGWLCHVTGKNPRIRVLPLEKLVAEVFRSCRIRQISAVLRTRIVGTMCNLHKTGFLPLIEKDEREGRIRKIAGVSIELTEEHLVQVQSDSSINFVKSILHCNTSWNRRLRLGCHWHQREDSSGGILYCSLMCVKKWMYLTLEKALKILDRDPDEVTVEMSGLDMKPQNWTMGDSIGIEARQRFGLYGEISEERRCKLEEDFIFPRFLAEFRERFPNGMTRQPREIIWPLDRDIEIDLNYSPNAPCHIRDPDPRGRAQRREMMDAVKIQITRRQLHRDW